MDDDQVQKLQHVADLTALTYQRFKTLKCTDDEAYRLTEMVLRLSLGASQHALTARGVTPSPTPP